MKRSVLATGLLLLTTFATGFAAQVAAPPPPPPPAAVATLPVPVRVKGLPVLRLSGTPHEMGFQQGHALAAGIKEGFEEFVLRYRCHGIRARYTAIRKRVETELVVPEAIRTELEGMLAGMQASGVDLALPMLKRDVDATDLLVLNTIDHWGLFGCSGFVAWGSCTQDGEVMTARNFDFDVDAEKQAIVRLGVVLACAPRDGKRFLSFAFPGLVGVATGVNEDGVGTFLHVANGTFGGGEEGLTFPLMLISRQVIEEADAAGAIPLARRLLAGARVRNSFLFRVVTPGGDTPPTAVFELDSLGVQEQPLPDPAKGELPLLIATNHYLARESGFTAIPDSKVRYCNLEARAKKCLDEGDRRIDPDEAWQGLKDVNQEIGNVTLHALVWQPRSLELRAAFSLLDEKTRRASGAPRQPPAHMTLRELFGD